MTQYDVFLSHNSQDKPAVEELARRLTKSGIQPWLDKWNLIPGEPWMEAIEEALDSCAACAVFVGPSGTGPWQNEEMRVAIQRRVDERREGERPFRVIPVLLPGAERGERSRLPAFLVATTWVEFHRALDDEEAFHRLACGIRGIAPGPTPGEVVYEGVCPYRGLRFFDVQHAPFFFGRKPLIGWLVNSLRGDNCFLAVVGPSGSGKSSLARAGLVAALKRGEIEGSETWPTVVCRPGPDPLESLAVALGETSGIAQSPSAVRDLMRDLREDKRMLHVATRLALRGAPPERRLALLVDQFEEMFTLCRDETLRQALVDNLLYAAGVTEGQTVVLLTLRADFYSKCAVYPRLADALSDHQVLVGPMNADELRRAIERPAQLAGCEFEPGLVERLWRDVEDQPGGLPLLQHALLELWGRREGRRLTHAAYQAIGGVEGALERRAEVVYGRFTGPEQMICRRVFLRLTQPGEGTEDTKRRATLQELLPAEGEREMVEDVVRTLSGEESRLVTTEGEETPEGEQFVEVAHEALIGGWSRLREWIEDDHESLRLHRQLTEAAQEWERHDKGEDFLYRGGRLAAMEEWAGAHVDDLNALEREFLKASVALCKREERRQRELEATRQLAEVRRRSMRRLLLATLALLVLAGVAVYFALRTGIAERLARQQASLAQSSAMVGQALFDLNNGYTERAVLFGLEALENYSYSWQAEHVLGRAVQQSRIALFIPSDGYPGGKPSWSPDGTRVTAYVGDGVRVWSASTGEELLRLPHPSMVQYTAWSSDGTRILTVCIGGPNGDGTARVWDAVTGVELLTVRLFEEGDESTSTYPMAWSPDGTRLLSYIYDRSAGGHTARVWDGETGKELLRFPGSRPVWSPDGKYILFKCDEAACVVDAATGEEELEFRHPSPVFDVAWSPDGARIFTGDEEGTIKVWDAITNEELLTIPSTHGGGVKEMRWSPNGKRLLARDERLSIHIWDTVTGEQVCIIPNDSFGVSRDAVIDWSPDGMYIVTSMSLGYTAKVWDATTGEELFTFYGRTHQLYYPVWSPDGTRVLTAGKDMLKRGGVTIWNATPDTALLTLSGHTDAVHSAAWSPDGTQVVSASEDGSARIWDVNAAPATMVSAATLVLSGHMDAVYSAAWSPGGGYIVTASEDGTAKVWSASTGEELITFSGHTGAVNDAAWSPDGICIATAGDDHTAKVWNATTGEELLTLSDHTDAVSSVAWSPDGTRIATASKDRTARIWDASMGTELLSLVFYYRSEETHKKAVNSVAWSEDSTRIVTASDDRTAKVWDASTGKIILDLSGMIVTISDDPFLGSILLNQGLALRSATWSPDGGRIVTTGDDRRVKVWNVVTREQLFTLSGHTGSVNSVVWSPAGETRIVTASDDGTAKVWRVWSTTEDLIDYARQCCVVRKLTDEERQQFGLSLAVSPYVEFAEAHRRSIVWVIIVVLYFGGGAIGFLVIRSGYGKKISPPAEADISQEKSEQSPIPRRARLSFRALAVSSAIAASVPIAVSLLVYFASVEELFELSISGFLLLPLLIWAGLAYGYVERHNIDRVRPRLFAVGGGVAGLAGGLVGGFIGGIFALVLPDPNELYIEKVLLCSSPCGGLLGVGLGALGGLLYVKVLHPFALHRRKRKQRAQSL